VAIAVEEHLRKLQAKGEGVLNADQEKDGVCLTFNDVVAQAADFDIAFVRLASALLDDRRFKVPLMQALRPPMFLAHEHRLQVMRRLSESEA
jgi:hypothetical protein